jgi:hypothetical protein
MRASTKIDNKTRNLHRLIMSAGLGEQIDHRDHNGLNCRRSNLRFCSTSQNNRNRRKMSRVTTSVFKGVCWAPSSRKWVAYIALNSKRNKNLGSFHWQLEAAMAYDRAALRLFGDYAFTNFGLDRMDKAA